MSYPVLASVNCTAWVIKVQAILDAQGLWEAVATNKGVDDARKNKMTEGSASPSPTGGHPHAGCNQADDEGGV
jgi:hypothetical protein